MQVLRNESFKTLHSKNTDSNWLFGLEIPYLNWLETFFVEFRINQKNSTTIVQSIILDTPGILDQHLYCLLFSSFVWLRYLFRKWENYILYELIEFFV